MEFLPEEHPMLSPFTITLDSGEKRPIYYRTLPKEINPQQYALTKNLYLRTEVERSLKESVLIGDDSVAEHWAMELWESGWRHGVLQCVWELLVDRYAAADLKWTQMCWDRLVTDCDAPPNMEQKQRSLKEILLELCERVPLVWSLESSRAAGELRSSALRRCLAGDLPASVPPAAAMAEDVPSQIIAGNWLFYASYCPYWRAYIRARGWKIEYMSQRVLVAGDEEIELSELADQNLTKLETATMSEGWRY